MTQAPARTTAVRPLARALACSAGALGLLYAAVSAYWGAGGTALLDTIGGTLEHDARAGSVALSAVVWATVALKLIACAVGLLAVGQPRWLRPRELRAVRGVAWLAAAVLVLYGGILTLVGVLVQADIVHASAHADRRALRWHAFLWDPWFLVWGLLLAAALTLTRPASIGRLHRRGVPSRART